MGLKQQQDEQWSPPPANKYLWKIEQKFTGWKKRWCVHARKANTKVSGYTRHWQTTPGVFHFSILPISNLFKKYIFFMYSTVSQFCSFVTLKNKFSALLVVWQLARWANCLTQGAELVNSCYTAATLWWADKTWGSCIAFTRESPDHLQLRCRLITFTSRPGAPQ